MRAEYQRDTKFNSSLRTLYIRYELLCVSFCQKPHAHWITGNSPCPRMCPWNHILNSQMSSLNIGIVYVRTWSFQRTVCFSVGVRELQVILDFSGVRASMPEMEPLPLGLGPPLADRNGDVVREKVTEDKCVQNCRYQQGGHCQCGHAGEYYRDRLGYHIGHFVRVSDGCYRRTGHREGVSPPCQREPVKWKFHKGERVSSTDKG